MNLDLIRSYKCLLGSLCWIILGYLANKTPVLLKPTFNPILVTPDPRITQSTSCSSTQNHKNITLKSTRDYNLNPSYPFEIATWTIFQHTINYTIVLSPPDPNKFGLFGSRKLAYPQQFFTSYYTIQLCYSISQAKQSTVQLFPSSPWNLYVFSISIIVTLWQK